MFEKPRRLLIHTFLVPLLFWASGLVLGADVNRDGANCQPIEGWMVIPQKSIKEHRADWDTADASGSGWRVRLREDGRGVQACRCTLKQDCHPKDDRPKAQMPEGAVWRYDLEEGAGVLAGSNRGEFGGEVWLFSEDLRRRQQLAREPAVHVFALQSNVYVVLGWSHLGLSKGDIYRLDSSPGGRSYKLKVVAKLGEMPFVFARQKDCEYLVGQTRVGRFCSSGKLTIVAGPSPDRARPDIRSIDEFPRLAPDPINAVVDENGTLFVGVAGGVVRVQRNDHLGTLDWLAPAVN